MARTRRRHTGVFKRGDHWWFAYCCQGREHRKSAAKAGYPDTCEGATLARSDHLVRYGTGRRQPSVEAERLTLHELLGLVVRDYWQNGRRSLTTLCGAQPNDVEALERVLAAPFAGRLGHLERFFGRDARALEALDLERYKTCRLREQAGAATVNRELAALRRAYRLAVADNALRFPRDAVPIVRMLEENNVREGFVEPEAFATIVTHLPADLQDFAWFALLTSWRKGSVARLEWRAVDRERRVLRLLRVWTKTRQAVEIPLTPALWAIIERRWQARFYRALGGERNESRYVFHRAGKPVGDFRKAWATACKAAELDDVWFHDLRRSGIRLRTSAGVREKDSMYLSGHRTRKVFDRYTITTLDDARQALERAEAVLQARLASALAADPDARAGRLPGLELRPANGPAAVPASE